LRKLLSSCKEVIFFITEDNCIIQVLSRWASHRFFLILNDEGLNPERNERKKRIKNRNFRTLTKISKITPEISINSEIKLTLLSISQILFETRSPCRRDGGYAQRHRDLDPCHCRGTFCPTPSPCSWHSLLQSCLLALPPDRHVS